MRTKETSNNHYILICDDIPENCFFLETFLKLEGYEVEIVNSGRAALTKIEAKKPDLLLLDLMMPDMDGYQLARLIQQNPVLKFLPILLIIALEEALTTSASSDLKLYGIIRKPIDPDGLLEQIKGILEC